MLNNRPSRNSTNPWRMIERTGLLVVVNWKRDEMRGREMK